MQILGKCFIFLVQWWCDHEKKSDLQCSWISRFRGRTWNMEHGTSSYLFAFPLFTNPHIAYFYWSWHDVGVFQF